MCLTLAVAGGVDHWRVWAGGTGHSSCLGEGREGGRPPP